MITGTLNTGGYKFATTGNIDAERLDMGGAGVEIAGDVAVRTMNVSGSDNLIEGNLWRTEEVLPLSREVWK